MYWWGDQVSGWGWALMSIGMIVFWAAVILGIVALVRYLRSADRRSAEQVSRPTPEQLLAERYARGEIDETEYQQRMDTLHVVGPHGRPTSRT